jgi:hypothetical protein
VWRDIAESGLRHRTSRRSILVSARIVLCSAARLACLELQS